MEINYLLLGALENLLGKGYKRARGNFAFHCPHCHHRKPKLEVNLDIDSPSYQYYECWVCGEKGRSIRTLLKHLSVSQIEMNGVLQFVGTGTGEKEMVVSNNIMLPEEFQSLYVAPLDSYEANRCRQYLYRRGLTDDDFIKYNIGYCSSGKYRDRVIIPSYDENNRLNYFVARSMDSEAYLRYLNPEVVRDNIIPFCNLVNWNESIILCEGPFDAITLKRNCIPLLGKRISSALMKKIIENPVPEIYICTDQDAKKASLENCEKFLALGKKVYFVEPPKKDASESGFEEMIKILQTAKELDLKKLLELKLEL